MYYAKNGVAKFVVITDAEVSGSTNDVIFVVGEDQTSIKKNKTGSTEYYVYDAVVNGEVTSIKVKASSEAQKALAKVENNDVVVNGKTYTNKNIAIFFGMTKDSNGYVTKLTTATPKDVAAQLTQTTRNSTKILATGTQSNSDVIGGIEWTGTKRESNGGNVSFGYTVDGKGKVSYTNSLAANSKALVVYYDGEDLSVVSKVNTDNDDQATVITDDGDIIAVLVREFDGTKLTHG